MFYIEKFILRYYVQIQSDLCNPHKFDKILILKGFF